MTKYILHGGQTRVENEHNKAFYQEWVKDFMVDYVPTILLCYYARPRHEWPELEQNDRENFSKYNNRAVNFIVGDKDTAKLKEQIKDADELYFRGGKLNVLMERLLPIKDELLQLWQGKVYVGSSAGVMMLAHNNRSIESDWKQGFGLIPINTIVHWNKDLATSYQAFKQSKKDDYEDLLIPETEFVVRMY